MNNKTTAYKPGENETLPEVAETRQFAEGYKQADALRKVSI